MANPELQLLNVKWLIDCPITGHNFPITKRFRGKTKCTEKLHRVRYSERKKSPDNP